MPSNAMCCGHWITLREDGAGFDHDFDCRAFMSDPDPAWADVRRSICQQLFNADRLCPAIAPFCERYKEDMQRERSRARDDRELTDPTASPFSGPVDATLDVASMIPVLGDTVDAIRDVVPNREAWERGKAVIHAALDVAGMFPALGIVPDAINTAMYSIEGDWANAGISAIAMVEGIGEGASLSRRGVNITEEAVEKLGPDGLTAAMRDAKVRSASSAGELTGEMHAGFPVRRYPPGPEWRPDPIRVREVDVPTDFDAVGTSRHPRVSTTTAHSEVLASNLTQLVGDRPPGHAAHHIVPTSAGGTAGDRAREILAASGIDLDSADNGIWLPETTLDGTIAEATSSHGPIHTTEYFENVTRRLEAAAEGGEQAVRDALAEIYQILLENPNALNQ